MRTWLDVSFVFQTIVGPLRRRLPVPPPATHSGSGNARQDRSGQSPEISTCSGLKAELTTQAIGQAPRMNRLRLREPRKFNQVAHTRRHRPGTRSQCLSSTSRPSNWHGNEVTRAEAKRWGLTSPTTPSAEPQTALALCVSAEHPRARGFSSQPPWQGHR